MTRLPEHEALPHQQSGGIRPQTTHLVAVTFQVEVTSWPTMSGAGSPA